MSDAKALALEQQIKLKDLHDRACERKKDFYKDPFTGYQVMTAHYLTNRGFCCENDCRHCPFNDKRAD